MTEFQEVVNDTKYLPQSNLKGEALHKLPGHQSLCWVGIREPKYGICFRKGI